MHQLPWFWPMEQEHQKLLHLWKQSLKGCLPGVGWFIVSPSPTCVAPKRQGDDVYLIDLRFFSSVFESSSSRLQAIVPSSLVGSRWEVESPACC